MKGVNVAFYYSISIHLQSGNIAYVYKLTPKGRPGVTLGNKITTFLITTAVALSTATGIASASPQSPKTQCSAERSIHLTEGEGDKTAEVTEEQKQLAIDLAAENLKESDNAEKLGFQHADVMATQAGAEKVWVTVAQEREDNSEEDYIFYRVATDLEKKEVVSVQRFDMTPEGEDANEGLHSTHQ